jgi:hypothetical protein
MVSPEYFKKQLINGRGNKKGLFGDAFGNECRDGKVIVTPLIWLQLKYERCSQCQL